MKYLFKSLLIFIFAISVLHGEQEITWQEWSKLNSIEVSKLAKNLQDSLLKYYKYNDSIMYLYTFENNFLDREEINSQYINSSEDKYAIITIDTFLNKFIFYRNTLSTNMDGPFFINKNMYLLSQKNLKSKCSYLRLFLIKNESIDSCKEFVFVQQDFTRLSKKDKKYTIIYEDGLLKIRIESYKQCFSWSWLFFWWVPRGTPQKWEFDYDSRKDYWYTIDLDLNVVSIEEIPIETN